MSDFSSGAIRQSIGRRVLNTFGRDHSGWGEWYGTEIRATPGAATAWPAANRALFAPVCVYEPTTVYQMGVEVGTSLGNIDVGIYNEESILVVSSGTVAMGAAGIQLINITDTLLQPAVYFFAAGCSGTAKLRASAPTLPAPTMCGCQQMSSGVPLPGTATMINQATSHVPWVFATCNVAAT